MRKLKWWAWVIVIAVVGGAGAGGFLWAEHARAVSIGAVAPSSGTVFGSHAVSVTCSLQNYQPGRGRVTVSVDGEAVAESALSSGHGSVKAGLTLADGSHEVTFDYSSSNPFSRHHARSITVVVDTMPPVVTLVSPAAAAAKTLADSGTGDGFTTVTPLRVEAASTEPVAQAALTVDGVQVPVSISNDRVTAEADLTDGSHDLVLAVGDKVGNVNTTAWRTRADLSAPVVTVTGWPGDTWKQNEASLAFAAEDTFADGLSVHATLDGKPVPATPEQEVPVSAPEGTLVDAASSQAAARSGTSGAAQGAGLAPTPTHRSFSTGRLTDGTHEVQVTATDIAGHTTTWSRSFVVETTETLGEATLGPGAVGKDVKELQQILAKRGLYKGEATSVLDGATAQALAAYKSAHKLAAAPLVDAATLKGLMGFIKVDRGKRTLTLYQDGRQVKTYGVAVGQPAYPTPVGTFVILRKEVNPTWYPPDSPWARGAKPIGPGPSCPLQARAMWISAPAIGIHGTNSPGSIGSAASHGCIRMRAAEVIDLYDRVFIGTTVQIVD